MPNINEELINEYIGEVGESIEKKVKITFIKKIKAKYGATNLITCYSEDGYKIVFFDNKQVFNNLHNEVLTINGNIKTLQEYNKIKQTVINYVKIVKD